MLYYSYSINIQSDCHFQKSSILKYKYRSCPLKSFMTEAKVTNRTCLFTTTDPIGSKHYIPLYHYIFHWF